MTPQQFQDLSAFRDEVRQAEFVLFDLRAKLRLMEATHKRPADSEKLVGFGGLLEKAMSDLEEVIDNTALLIRKNTSHAKPA